MVNTTSPQTFGGIISGSGNLYQQNSSGITTLTGSNTYTGTTTISGGTLAYSGSGSYSGNLGASGNGSLVIGTAAGNGVLAVNTTGTVAFGGQTFNVGTASGAGRRDLPDSGAVNAKDTTSVGYVNLASIAGGYGYYSLTSGNLNLSVGGAGGGWTGLRVGQNGLGSYVQSGGTMSLSRYFSIGTGSAVNSAASGVATFTGGSAASSTAFSIFVGEYGSGVLNIGTEAGGTALFTSQSTTGNAAGTGSPGLVLAGQSGGNGTLNLNSGTLAIAAGSINKGTGGASGVVNFNGGTLQATAAGLTLIDNSPTSVNIYQGGAIFNMAASSGTVSANLLAASGSGVYPPGGSVAIASSGGSGYIGAPLVKVWGGAGSGAMASPPSRAAPSAASRSPIRARTTCPPTCSPSPSAAAATWPRPVPIPTRSPATWPPTRAA